MENGNRVWPTPPILSWSVWIQNCWREFAENSDEQRIVLTSWQQHLVWTDIIQTDIEQQQNFLWNQTASVSQAINAWELCHDYELEPNTWKQVTGDFEVFKRWYQGYLTVLQSNNWLDPAQLINIMLANDYHQDTSQLIFLDQTFTPNQNKWIRHIESANRVAVEFLAAQVERKGDFEVDVYDDFEKEIKACAHWAREEIKQNSKQTIGIVIPDLKKRAKSVSTLFRRVFSPAFDLGDDEVELFELIDTGPINQTGFISSALNCLELLRFKFNYDCFSHFLRDVFLMGRQERQYHFSLLDVELKQRVQAEQTLSNLIFLCEHTDSTQSFVDEAFLTQLEKLKQLHDSLPRYASVASWCNTFSTALNLLGWPDISKLNSTERKLLGQWNQLLAQMCTGGLVTRKLTLIQALAQLNELASQMSVKQSQQGLIKILDLNDISRAYFDKVWVSGLSDSVLPVKTILNPLLPFNVQRKFQIPFSDSSSCLQQAKTVYLDLINSSKEIRFSYFKSDQGSEFRVSPLINHLLINEHKTVSESEFKYSPDIKLEFYQDDTGLPLNDGSVAGGTYLLKTQSACPFQAYASFRLKADPIQSTEPGLDAAEKGILVHDVLRRIWQQLRTQLKLKSLARDELVALVGEIIDISLKRLEPSQLLFSQIEKTRLTDLIINWLEIEQLREISFAVIAQEHKLNFNLDSIHLELKIDRIDELEDGRRIIIDYKTGNTDSNQWIRDINRLEDPQLPVYLLAENEKTHAISFAGLKNMKFDGLANGDTGVDGIDDINKSNKKFLKQHQIEDWEDLCQRWQLSIEALAQEYIQGIASVVPRDPVSQCKYCQRHSLCRLYQQHDFIAEADVAS